MVRVTNACLLAEIDVFPFPEDNKTIILLLVSNLASQSKVYQVYLTITLPRYGFHDYILEIWKQKLFHLGPCLVQYTDP